MAKKDPLLATGKERKALEARGYGAAKKVEPMTYGEVTIVETLALVLLRLAAIEEKLKARPPSASNG